MKALKITIIAGILLILLYCAYLLVNTQYQEYCGIITFKGNGTQINKYSSYTEFILVVEVDNNNEKHLKDVLVDPSIWSNNNVGDEYCWNEEIHPSNLVLILGAIGCSITIMGILSLIVYGLYWLFKDLI